MIGFVLHALDLCLEAELRLRVVEPLYFECCEVGIILWQYLATVDARVVCLSSKRAGSTKRPCTYSHRTRRSRAEASASHFGCPSGSSRRRRALDCNRRGSCRREPSSDQRRVWWSRREDRVSVSVSQVRMNRDRLQPTLLTRRSLPPSAAGSCNRCSHSRSWLARRARG
jgi:hypothetical protein